MKLIFTFFFFFRNALQCAKLSQISIYAVESFSIEVCLIYSLSNYSLSSSINGSNNSGEPESHIKVINWKFNQLPNLFSFNNSGQK